MSQRKSQGNAQSWIIMLALGALAVLGAWMLTKREIPPPIERSAIGFDGLAGWLAIDGIETRRFLGQGPLSGDGVGLRILPLYDADLRFGYRSTVISPEQRYLDGTQRSIPQYVVTTKLETLPTLLILPKWRDGVRLMGATHPEFLIHGAADEAVSTDEAEGGEAVDPDPAAGETAEEADADDTIAVFEPPVVLPVEDTGWISLPMTPFTAGTARLRAPQWIETPDGCSPLVGDAGKALLVECRSGEAQYWILSDPDLLNNHGLREGENAMIARDLVRELAGSQDVLLDYSTAVFLTARPDEHQRGWADILRMFEPPFTWLWLAAGGLLILLLWRAGVRGRPLYSIFEHGHGAARRVALHAQARLMRNAHADGALIRTLVAGRRQALAEAWLGRDRKAGHAFERTVALLRLKDRDLADRLTDIFNRADALPDRIRPEVAVDALADVEDVYQLALELA